MLTHVRTQYKRIRPSPHNLLLAVTLLLTTGMQARPNQAVAATQQGGELLIASFTSGPRGATSVYEYSGSLTLTVSGIGQASGTAYTDAFYQLTDGAGNPIPPYYPGGWTLSINEQLAVDFIPDHEIPDYRPDHAYTFTINAPGGHLTLGVHDLYTLDNSGSYIIQISGASLGEVPFFSQRDKRWIEHPLRTDGECSLYCRYIGTCGCTLTSATMLFDYYGANLLPSTLSDCMGTKACLFNWSVGAACSQGDATQPVKYAFSFRRLDQQLNQTGRPVILGMHKSYNKDLTHSVLVISGHGSDSGGYLVHDPYPLEGANTNLSALERNNYVFDWLVVYDGQPLCSRNSGSLTTETSRPASLPALLPTPPIDVTGQSEAPSALACTSGACVAASSIVTGTATIYHVYETAVTFQLTATSGAGEVTDMKVWTDSNPTSEWQPFETLTWLPWQPEDQVHALFRDEAGNISDESSDSISPPGGPPPELFSFSFLPMVSKSP